MSSEQIRSRQTDPDTGRARPAPGRETAQQAALHPLLRLQRQAGNAAVSRLLQREGDDDEGGGEEEEEEEMGGDVQAKHDTAEVGMEGGPLSSGLASRIESQRGQGSGLDEGTRTTMESAFGTSFGDVRVHTGSEADSLNRSISARAFTTGSDIFVRRDQNPSDSSLIAHELTHVVQQRSMGSGGGPMQVGPADDSSEHAADAVADSVVGRMAEPEQAEEE